MNNARYSDSTPNAANTGTIKMGRERHLEKFDLCTVKIENSHSDTRYISRWNPLETRIKSSLPYVFAAQMPVGEYKIEDYSDKWVLLKHKKTERYYLNDALDWLRCRCLSPKCYGRGYKTFQKKRESITQLRKKYGDDYVGVAGNPYYKEKCRDCEGTGLVSDLLPKYPQKDEALSESLSLNSVKELHVYKNGEWIVENTKAKKA